MVKQRHTTDMETQVKKEPIGYAMVPADVSRAPRRMPTAPMNDAEEASRYIRERDQIEWTDGFDCAMQRKDLTIVATREFAAGWMAGRRMSNELHMRGYIATKRDDA